MPKAAQYLPDAGSLESDKGAVLDVYQCSACGLVQLNNEPVPYYREVIRAAAFSPEMGEFRQRQFRNFLEKFSLAGKKILEIGCGRGEYLSLMQQAGANAYGLEYGREAVKHCVKNGMKAYEGFIQKSTDNVESAPFDAFFIMNFLEHLPDPNATLRGISNNMSDGALGLVEVPNFDMLLKNNLFSEFIGDHLFYFTKRTLNALLERNGLEVLESSIIWHDYIISSVVRKRISLDLSQFSNHQAKLKKEIDDYLCRFWEKKVAVWGAGHQALAVMALADMGGKIRYVVDSAPFKQGKFTPATHIPIVSPDTLDSDPVDAVIIMAASYSDEVARIIRQKFGQSMAVAILRDSELEMV
jgi:2-polyprenyl-3-methyl-5-hydroxy-6-metoxy-1,4-benzoquinol methylase